METKTYFASSLQAAMEVARRELGPDAMLVDSKPVSEAGRAVGPLEVTFAWEAGNAAASLQQPLQVRRTETGLEEIRLEISSLRAAIGRSATGPQAIAGQPVVRFGSDADDLAVKSLCESGFEKDTA